jgi:hypothetical protein
MKTFRLLAEGVFLVVFSFRLFAQATNTNSVAISQWDFNQGDLRATAGQALVFRGDTGSKTTFEEVLINGSTAKVMRFPAATPAEGFRMFHGLGANGGGTNLNQYTLIMDVMWPSESDQSWRALFQSDTNNANDAEMFVNIDNALGVENNYAGQILPNTWYRLGFVFDLTNRTMTNYINGAKANSQFLEATAVDSRFSLKPELLLFTDDDGETQPGYVNSIQIRAEVLSETQMMELGGATAAGIPGLPSSGEVKIESIRKEGNNVVITVSGGGNLQLQKKVKINDATWQNLQSSSSGTFTVPCKAPAAGRLPFPLQRPLLSSASRESSPGRSQVWSERARSHPALGALSSRGAFQCTRGTRWQSGRTQHRSVETA